MDITDKIRPENPPLTHRTFSIAVFLYSVGGLLRGNIYKRSFMRRRLTWLVNVTKKRCCAYSVMLQKWSFVSAVSDGYPITENQNWCTLRLKLGFVR